MATWQELEEKSNAMAEKVRELKAGGDKEAIDAGVKDMLAAKEELRVALEAAIAAETDTAAADVLRAKLPPAPKSKADKKKAGKDTAAAEANLKAAEEAKAAARAKKKAEKEAKAKEPKPAEPPKEAPAAAASEPAPPAAPTAAPVDTPPAAVAAPQGAPAEAPGKAGKAVQMNKGFELHFDKEQPPLLALLAFRLAKQEVMLKRVERSKLPQFASTVLLLPLGQAQLLGADAAARYIARVVRAL